MARQRLLLTIQFVFLIQVLYAQQSSKYKPRTYAIQNDQKTYVDINSYLMILDDIPPHLSFEEVQKLSEGKSYSYYSRINNTPLQQSSWAKFSLINKSAEEFEWLLFTGDNDLVEVYITQKNGGYVLKKSGNATPISQKDIKKGYKSKVLLHLLPEQTNEIFIKIKQHGHKTPVFDLKIAHPEAWQQKILERNLVQGLFQGILWMMIFYSLFILLVSKEVAYAYYALYLFFSSVFFNYHHHLSAEFLLGDYPWLNYSLWFLSSLIPPAYFQFIRSFLNLKAILPYWDRIVLMLIRSCIILFLFEVGLFVIIKHDPLLKYIHIHSLLGILVAAAVVVLKIHQTKQKNIQYFSITSISLIISGLFCVFFVHYLRIPAGVYIAQLGIVIEILVFLFGLGYGIFIKENHRRKIQENLIAQLQQNEKMQYKLNRELEEIVQIRTAEIEQQKNKLEELNFIKDKLFSIISHDLRSPLTSLQGSLQALHLGLLNKEEEKSIFFNLNHKLNYTKDLLDNLLYWAMIQMEKVSTRFEEIHLHKLVDEVILGFKEVNNKNITLQNNISIDCQAYADKNMVLVIIRNLISNALKFTPENGLVQINNKLVDNYLEIEVEDNGIGMDKEEVNRLFKLDTHFSKPGTELERGTGLGLLLCKEFILKNEGQIFVKSQKNKGSKFIFTLKRKMNLVETKNEKYRLSHVILV